LVTRCVLLSNGSVAGSGDPRKVIGSYLNSGVIESDHSAILTSHKNRLGGMRPILIEAILSNQYGDGTANFSQAGNRVRIEVSDTGIGIPKTDRSRLFSDFFRAENARTVENTGTGLGLAIVKEFVGKLGGRILVESEEGIGTIFVVDLPVATMVNGGPHDSSENT